MATGIPLPRVVYDVQPGGGIITGMLGANALRKSDFENKIKEAEAQYAPYTQYANASSKLAYSNLLPYQIKAQLMSNPMVWMALKDNPEAIKSFVSSFNDSIPKGNNIFGNVNLPSPNNYNSGGGIFNQLNGILDFFKNKNGMNQSPSNEQIQSNNNGLNNPPIQPQLNSNSTQNETNPLIPSTGGDIEGVAGKSVAPYYSQVHKPGESFYDPKSGRIISTPTNETISDQQKAFNAARRVEPQLKKLASAAAPFLSAGGQAQLLYERGKNFFNIGKKGELPTQYAKFHSLIQSAPEALVKSYGLRPTNETIERMQKVIEPVWGETPDQYSSRIMDQLKSIKDEQIGIGSEQLSQGFNVGQANNNKKISKGAEILSKGLVIPEFGSKEEFQQWYLKQEPLVQDAIRKHLGKK